MTAFYVPTLKEGVRSIQGDEAQHCYKVLRKKPGDRCIVFDGGSEYYEVVLTRLSKHICEFETQQIFSVSESQLKLHICVAPTKNITRFEWFLEKSVELGVNEITPILCHNSVRNKLNMDRCKKILISAAKQSQHYKMPTLNPIESFNNMVTANKSGNPFIAYCADDLEYFNIGANSFSECLVVIGPEGDFNSSEIKLAYKSGFKGISLGNNRLRTETAAVFVCSKIYDYNQK